MNTPDRASAYRHDLDGLRGLAIALVVLFHVFGGTVSGGVDVFLLLSGFFFLGAQIRNADRPGQSINPLHSLWRTARRLLPALIVVLAATTAAAIAWFPQLQSPSMAGQLSASVLYRQNIVLARQAEDYAVAGSTVSPLQHLWSMSVQGQFYLGAVLLVSAIAFVLRRRNSPRTVRSVMPPILLVATVASFGYATWLHGTSQGLNYYSTWSRIWEIAAGGLLIYVTAAMPIPAKLKPWLPAIGVAMIVATGFFLDGAALFPGPWALWPLLGAALVVLGGGTGVVSAWLASRPMRRLGDIAYALYLWHWPLLILGLLAVGADAPGKKLGSAVIAASLVLAWLTHRFVEKPLMMKGKRPKIGDHPVRRARADLRTEPAARRRALAGAALGLLALTMLAAFPVQKHRIELARAEVLDPAAYPGARAVTDGAPVPDDVPYRPGQDLINNMWPLPAQEGCLSESGDDADHIETVKRYTDESPCVYGDVDSDKSIVLVGGSHSEQWFSPLEEVARDNGYRLEVILRPGCATFLSPVWDMSDRCADWSHAVVAHLADVRPDLVVTTSSRPGFENTDYTPDGYVDFWRALTDMSIPVVGIRDTPWLIDDADGPYRATDCVAAGGDPVTCGPLRERVLSPGDPAHGILESLPGGYPLDFSDVLCGPVHCPAVIGNIYVYRDDNHLSDQFAQTMSAEMKRRMAPILDDIERTGRTREDSE
ncbi:acyltransferase family protein [Corynebacterium sp. HMSC11E11]|uniref:acyltransferase family protein n=1 Tax=Corynebacterium sp. HMSC11E11 TaxID=1581089 RepID=UPI0008A45BF9|nr:acyltransferase family protein [Corynebacterium sp. HMSC11E11]